MKCALTILALGFSALFASDKYYLESNQIALSEKTIFVQLDEGMIEIDHLCVDQGGIYFEAESARCLECRKPLDLDFACHKRLNPKNTCHKRLNPKNTCHKRLNPKNTCEFT